MRLKELRAKYNYTQKYIAEYTGYGQTLVSKWEKHEREPDTETLIKLSNLFNVSVDYLIGNDTEEKHAQQRNAKVLTQIQQEVTKKIAELPDSDVMRVFDFIQGLTAKENEYFKLK